MKFPLPLKLYTRAEKRHNYCAATNLLMHTDDGVFRDVFKSLAKADEGGMDVVSAQRNINMLEWVAEYIQEQGGVSYDDVHENWRFVNLNWDCEAHQTAIRLINDGALPYTHT